MRIASIGGGPAGLYFAIAMKLRGSQHDIAVFERNKAGDTFGWGVVFSDQTLANLTATDPVSAKTISDSFAHWDDIAVTVGEETSTSSGHGFIGIGRKHLLQILQARAQELGVELHFEHECSSDPDDYPGYDLIVASDGVNSAVRTRFADHFDVDIDVRRNKFMWLGTKQLFDAFAFIFEPTEHGWVWAHAYRFNADTSTFIVECSPETWEGLGLDRMEQDEAIAFCERLFARHLGGHKLITNAGHLRGSAAWINFRRVSCGRWSRGNLVLLGDAAHTAHFSIGSGTKLALEDAIKLAEVLDRPGLEAEGALTAALAEYEEERRTAVLRIQNAARNSTEWFEDVDRYIGFDLPQFAYALLTRSQRISHENLRLRDREWLEEAEGWFRSAQGADQSEGQPLFTPMVLRDVRVSNRVVMAPMLTYMADADGFAGDRHLVHYGARALGGTGLIISEMLAVSSEGRPTIACPGLWDDRQAALWHAVNTFIHANSDSRTCAQIGHAGARAACRAPEGGRGYDVPLDDPWPILSASAKAWKPGGLVPAEATMADLARIKDDFVTAARRAYDAGFDMLEVHAGHGFLLSSFITPIMNQREDVLGGDLAARMDWPLEVIRAVRAVWPQTRPLLVRISATDWSGAEGIEPADAVQIARMLKAEGVDLIDVSAGETNPLARPVYGRMFQTPFADLIRNEVDIPVIAVGNIEDADQANSILLAGRADLIGIGRPHLANPMFTLHAAAKAAEPRPFVPAAVRPGYEQMARAEAKLAEALRA
ncbi:bifunctional salicylyl-CoA 5-hydroxylase/oxidoreductase [Erythrobacter sp. NFXS35]|uniref:bifunctional salicylyl-CoA 5-hydroxylase/oxidoreductase n=1 Tax=Erythrobacter sp. NFXS35 TaxID=2818436 RepID=UPI0032DE431F